MNSRTRFAPISSAKSGRLNFVVGYFALSGVVVLAFLMFSLGHAAVVPGSAIREGISARPIWPLVNGAIGVLMLLVARLLSRRRRAGAILAAALLVLPIVGSIGDGAIDPVGLVLNGIGLLLIASVWSELWGGDDSESRSGT